MKTHYAELGASSAFSFLQACGQPHQLVEQAAQRGLECLALTDFGGVYGAVQFHQAARKAGIHPIIGTQIRLPNGGKLRLLCKDHRGYQNLCRLLTLSHAQSPKGIHQSKWEDIQKYSCGIFALLNTNTITKYNTKNLKLEIKNILQYLKNIYGKYLYIEICRHMDRHEAASIKTLEDAASAFGVPLVATNDVRHPTPRDKPLLDVMTCMAHHTTLDAAGRTLLPNAQWSLKSPAQMQAMFADTPQALRNTAHIAEQCEFSLDAIHYQFPAFPTPASEPPMRYLRALTYAGAHERYRPLTQKARKQLEHELTIIERLDLAGYFLIVWDIVRYARSQGILAQGRGSAANSAVCYSLGITAVDPVRRGLLFERFLSEQRGEWPDIDIDLPSRERRERVIQYVYDTYGPRGAAMTANVITYRPRLALREVGKALGFDFDTIDRVSKVGGRWHEASDTASLLDQLGAAGLDTNERRAQLWATLTQQLLDTPRHLGQHSGGMVIAAGYLDQVVPIEPASMPNRSVVQWDKDDCASMGIIKVDLLGLGMLQVLEEAATHIKNIEQVDIDYAQLPANDSKVFDMLCRADSIGVFQVESRAQMATLPRLKPRCFYDLVIQIALIRPGPIVGEMVHPYLRRRAGCEPVTYLHPSLEPILERTLGIPLFQEQLLRMAMAVADFTGGEAEELRRALGFKRAPQKMADIEQKLHRGMQAKGIDAATRDAIVHSITSFALYGFPESHSASFALIAYASAYLKAHHPGAFLCALLNAYPMGFYHPATLVKDAQRHGVHVMPVDITRSDWACTLEAARRVRLGLSYVHGMRRELADAIVRERKLGPFHSLADFERRVKLPNELLHTLAELGAFAPLGHTRRAALWQVAQLKERTEGLLGYIDDANDSPLPEMTLPERVVADFHNAHLSVGPHPMAFARPALAESGVLPAYIVNQQPHGRHVSTAGLVRVRQRPMTAKGFFFITLEDETGHCNLVLTPSLFEQHRPDAVGAKALWAHGRIQSQDGVVHLKCTQLAALETRLQSAAPSPNVDWGCRYG